MSNKLSVLLRKKPVLITIISVLTLAAGLGAAALLGVFNSSDKDTEHTSANAEPAVTQEGTVSFLDTDVKITAVDSDSLGVSLTSAFKLVFSKAPNEKSLEESLSIKPKQKFKLTKVSSKEYSMEFEKPLQSDSVYNFILSDNDTGERHSWAFQTKKAFNVVRTLPRHHGVQVPLASGIEITFSHENAQDIEKYFEITPAVKGRFEWHGKTVVFVPEALEESTIYTVTIKKGITVKGSTETLKEDYSFSFQTVLPETQTRRTYFEFSNTFYSFNPQTAPSLEIYAQEDMTDAEVPLEIYSYPDEKSFLKDLKDSSLLSSTWYLRDRTKVRYDETKLQKTATLTGRVARFVQSYWHSNFLVLPSALPNGYYLMVAEVDGEKYYTQVQVHPASVYIMKTTSETLAWLNDSATGEPLSGAELKLDGGKSVKADRNGLAVLDVPNSRDSSTFYLITPVSGPVYIAELANYSYQPYYSYYDGMDIADHYWSYIYLDKDVFLPTDKVNIWGIFKPRDGKDIQKDAVLELIRYNYYFSGDSEPSVLTSQNVEIAPDGTYTGTLAISNYNPGSYEVRLRIGDKIMQTRYLQVIEYTKPVYKIDVSKDKDYMYAWEKVNFDFTTSFFEGTPVSGIELDYYYSIGANEYKNGVLTSDTTGASKLTIQPSSNISAGWRPVSLYLSVNNREAEERQIQASGFVTVFPKDTMISMDSDIEGNKATLSFETNRIDLTKLKDESSNYYYMEEAYKGASVDMPVQVELYERYYEQIITGEYYDYINKVKRNTYDYREVNNLINQYSFNTVNGKYEIGFTTEKNKNYYVRITGEDSQGRFIDETEYIYNWDYYDPFDTSLYSLTSKDPDRTRKLGAPVSLEVKYKGEPVANSANGKFLFLRLQNGVMDYKLSPDPVFNFNYEEKFIPNIYIKAVYFDGANMYDAGILDYRYDKTEKNLTVSIKQDKEYYRPGETVNLAFDIKDANGQPHAAQMNISIVDEAFFAMYNQSVDLLSSIYGAGISSGILTEYLSYASPMSTMGPPMAEMGEGGDAYVRADFKDSALFTTVTAGNDGKAEVSFKLPDNLTSWRVTWQAVTQDLFAGSGKLNISAKLPFFVDTIFNTNFITGDNPSILMRSYGTELAENAAVDYKITVTQTGGASKSYTASGVAHKPVQLPIGPLSAGSYTVKVEASSGKLVDAMERKFRVSDSLLETSVTDYISLTENTTIDNSAKGLTSLVFYGEDSAALYNELHSLYWSWGQRLDQKLARQLAGKLLLNYFNEESYIDEEFDLRQYQTDDGGLALLTYDSSNPALSAKMAALAADGIDRDALAAYFKRILENEDTMPEDAAYSYWGLAALKEPVLLDIRAALASDELTPHLRLVLGAALAEIGDFQGAKDIYTEAMKRSGTITDTLAWLETGTRDESIDATALCSLIALKINEPEKLKLFNYIKSNSTSELLVNLESMIFVSNYIKQASLSNSFSYELNGVKKQVDLQNGATFRLDLTPELLASLRFSNIQGKVQVAASHVAPVSQIRNTDGNQVSILRTYALASDNRTTNDFNRSDKVKITITPVFGATAPDGYYQITDILPAGFRYIPSSYYYDNISWPDEVTGQKVVFGYHYVKANPVKPVVYEAIAVTEGTFTADNAAINHTDKAITGFTKKDQITIR